MICFEQRESRESDISAAVACLDNNSSRRCNEKLSLYARRHVINASIIEITDLSNKFKFAVKYMLVTSSKHHTFIVHGIRLRRDTKTI